MNETPFDLTSDPRSLGEAGASALMERLRTEILRHDHLYHVLARPEVSDDAYDRLFRRLVQLERAFPALLPSNSPTRRVGGEPQERFETIPHAAPMLSLESTQDPEEVARFDERVRKTVDGQVRYLLEPKLDGASIEIVYREGRLERAVTRGNGREGEGVTENVKTIPTVPLVLREEERTAPSYLAVRGEVLMYISAFERFNERLVERGAEPYASPRNSAAGAVRQLDPRITAERELECIAYDILAVEGPRFVQDEDVVRALVQWGFQVPERIEVVYSVEAIVDYHRGWNDERDELDYEIDGVVVKLDDLESRADLGSTSHHPRWALAFKFEPRKEITRVQRITVSVGRTGVLTPVALLLPVVVGGVTISRASLHNREEVRRKDVREGDRVRIQRAGDVIPQVVGRVEEPGRARAEPFQMPEECPACGTGVEEQGPFTVCPNRFGCPAQLEGRLVHFGSRSALDIAGLGTETARVLVERGLVREFADLFVLSAADLQRLPGFAEKSAQNLVAAIQAETRPELARFLYGLGIPEVGATVARDLAAHFGSLERILEASREELEEVEGIGPRMSEIIRAFLDEEGNRHAIQNVLVGGIQPEAPRTHSAHEAPLAGKRFVFTGGLAGFTRSRARELVERAGGRVVGSVSEETDYVVVGQDPGSKYERALELGVSVLDEEGFRALLAGSELRA